MAIPNRETEEIKFTEEEKRANVVGAGRPMAASSESGRVHSMTAHEQLKNHASMLRTNADSHELVANKNRMDADELDALADSLPVKLSAAASMAIRKLLSSVQHIRPVDLSRAD